MKVFSKFFLVLSLLSFTACTTLTGAEKCALIGQVQEGTQIGAQTHVGSSVGSTVFSYYNPHNFICKMPKTDEEKAHVAETLPIAKEKQKKRSREMYIYYITSYTSLGIATIIAYALITKKFSK